MGLQIDPDQVKQAEYSCFWDTKIGSIEAGKFADFILLDKDPTKVSIEDILKLKVESTFIGGQLVWEA